MEIETPKLTISWYWMIIPLVARLLRAHHHVTLMLWTWQNVEASDLPGKTLRLFGGLHQITWDSDYDSSQDPSEKQLEILKAHQVPHLNLSDKLLKISMLYCRSPGRLAVTQWNRRIDHFKMYLSRPWNQQLQKHLKMSEAVQPDRSMASLHQDDHYQ